jgi:hypothetical protein
MVFNITQLNTGLPFIGVVAPWVYGEPPLFFMYYFLFIFHFASVLANLKTNLKKVAVLQAVDPLLSLLERVRDRGEPALRTATRK